jgi:hypothetical protein
MPGVLGLFEAAQACFFYAYADNIVGMPILPFESPVYQASQGFR